ncbi:hypothetical protein [Parapedobacter soli]|uniref:hypothetical protein n=1 Tax=Parapedobacter soli TaxID=416955 RepID=UPI0021C6F632|nr:hypothetical protein [Parapedobacter soli]
MKRSNLKATALTLLLLVAATAGWACPVCEKQQPKVLRGVAHGAGPDNNWDYLIVGVITVIVLVTLYYSMKWLVRPGEDTPDHIKRNILDLD